MDCLQENIRNLGCNVRQLDKKSEKALLLNLKHQLVEKQDENLGWRLTRIMLAECNSTYLALPLQGASRKNLEKCTKLLLEFLVNNDYIDEASKLYQDLIDLALLKKVSIGVHLDAEAEAARLGGLREKMESFSGQKINPGPKEEGENEAEAPQQEGVADSWLLVDEPAEESKVPEEERKLAAEDAEAPQAKRPAIESSYFMHVLKIEWI